jgi:hypothetical protein
VLSNLCDTWAVERLTQIYYNGILVYMSFVLFVVLFQHVKSSKSKIILKIYPMNLYYSHSVLEPLWHELGPRWIEMH